MVCRLQNARKPHESRLKFLRELNVLGGPIQASKALERFTHMEGTRIEISHEVVNHGQMVTEDAQGNGQIVDSTGIVTAVGLERLHHVLFDAEVIDH